MIYLSVCFSRPEAAPPLLLLPRDQETQPLVLAQTWLFSICTKEEHGGAGEWSAVRWGLACLRIWELARVHTLGQEPGRRGTGSSP